MKAEWIYIGCGYENKVMNTIKGCIVSTVGMYNQPVKYTGCSSVFIEGEHYNKETGEFELIEDKTGIDSYDMSCDTCKYNSIVPGDDPCNECVATEFLSKWEPKK